MIYIDKRSNKYFILLHSSHNTASSNCNSRIDYYMAEWSSYPGSFSHSKHCSMDIEEIHQLDMHLSKLIAYVINAIKTTCAPICSVTRFQQMLIDVHQLLKHCGFHHSIVIKIGRILNTSLKQTFVWEKVPKMKACKISRNILIVIIANSWYPSN